MALNPKHAAFAREYVVDHNATQAAIRAGYSAKSAESQGSRLLRNAKVRSEIDRLETKAANKAEVTAEDVLRGLRREAEGLAEDTNASSRVAAWSWLGKALKLFTEKLEHAGKDGEPLSVSININRGKK